MNTNELTEVIRIYCKKDFPGYAIMIDGPWGIGKTYFIKQLFKENKSMKLVYISLYGVSSTSQIDDSVFSSLIGCADVANSDIKRAGDFIGKLVSAFGDKAEGSAAGALASLSGEALKKRTLKNINSDSVLVFDDFERSKLLQNETLAKINEFVEHQGLKVIILCDERAIKDDKYSQTKEKVILYTNGFERSTNEIVDICFETVGDIKCNNIGDLKFILTDIVKHFSLTNIRTIKYGLQCFRDIINRVIELDSQYKDSIIISEILSSSIALAVGYRDYGVSVSDLKKTVRNSTELAVSYHQRHDKKRSDEIYELTNWERFYEAVLGKGSLKIDFYSLFELVCKGYLNVSAIEEDLRRWEAKKAKPDSPITNLQLDQPVSDTVFEGYIDVAKGILQSEIYAFYSTAELYSFCRNLKFLHQNKAFSFNGNFDEKLKTFATTAAANCLNHTDPCPFIYDDECSVIKEIHSLLEKLSEELGSKLLVERAREKLLGELKLGAIRKIVDYGDDAFSKPIINNEFVTKLIEIFPTLDNASIRAFGIFIHKRFYSEHEYEVYKDEIAPLTDLLGYLEEYLRNCKNSISVMAAHILRNTIKRIIRNGEKYQKSESNSD